MKRTSRILTLLLALIIAAGMTFTMYGLANTTYRTVAVYTSGGFVPTDGFGRAITVREDPFTGTWKTYIDNNETNYTGIVSNSFGDWYCVNGVVDFSYSGLVENNEDVWIIQEGKVDNGFNGVYEDGYYLYSIEGGKVVSKELKETYKNSFLMIAIILAIVVAMIISSKKKKRAKKIPPQEPVKTEPIVDGTYSMSGTSIPKDHYQRPAAPMNATRPVRVTVKPKATTNAVRSEQNSSLNSKQQPINTQPRKAPHKPMPYKRLQLLSKNEYGFYKALKPIADTLGLMVIAKVRMGDLVYPTDDKNSVEFHSNWNRVKSRHVDFALVKPSNMYVELLIELDDASHKTEKAKKADMFKNAVYDFTGYKLLRINNTYRLEEKIRAKLAE